MGQLNEETASNEKKKKKLFFALIPLSLFFPNIAMVVEFFGIVCGDGKP